MPKTGEPTDERSRQVLRRLQRNGFDARFAETKDLAREIMLDLIPREATVGIGNSVTLRQLGVLEALEERGTPLINPMRVLYTDPGGLALMKKLLKQSITADVFLSGTNAVTMDGKLVNIDGVGNRVAGMIYCPDKVIIAIGRNKIVASVSEALRRIKNVVTPMLRQRRGGQVPCRVTGKCSECSAPRRSCRVTTILERRPTLTDTTVILIDEDLGAGFDPAWPQERIGSLRGSYEQFDWPYAFDIR